MLNINRTQKRPRFSTRSGPAPRLWGVARLAADRRRTKDPGIVVVDEVIGQWIAIAGGTTCDLAA
jgi:hypothetical protein